MSEVSSGVELRSIKNRAYIRLNTIHGKEIVKALDQCGVPYFARYNDKNISLTYDSDYVFEVDTVLTKAKSESYEQLIRERIRKKNTDENLKELLPEVATVLLVTVGQLEKLPDDIQCSLCKAYINLWLCDERTIRRELDRITEISASVIQDRKPALFFTLEQQRRVAEKLENEHLSRENDERRAYYEMVREK